MPGQDHLRRTVRLIGVPIHQFVQLQIYFDDMVREMQLIAVGVGDKGAAGRLADLAVYVQHDIAGHRNLIHAEALGAAAEGRTHVDVTLQLLPASVPDAHRLVEVAEALDAQSRSGLLLTAPASPEVIGVLRWIVSEVTDQIEAGRHPTPYPS